METVKCPMCGCGYMKRAVFNKYEDDKIILPGMEPTTKMAVFMYECPVCGHYFDKNVLMSLDRRFQLEVKELSSQLSKRKDYFMSKQEIESAITEALAKFYVDSVRASVNKVNSLTKSIELLIASQDELTKEVAKLKKETKVKSKVKLPEEGSEDAPQV